MQKIIISILHYNNEVDTIACLKSLLSLEHDNFSVVTYVLDNGSAKRFEIDESKYLKINLKVLRSEVNTGFAGGHNLIYEKIQDQNFDYFLLLNNDIILEKSSINELVKGFDNKSVGAVVPKIYFTSGHEFHKDRYDKKDHGKVIWYAGGIIDWNHVQSKHIGVDEVDKGQFSEEQEIDFATGACLLLTKEVIQKIGLFDEKYFLYYEDADLSIRIRKAGYKICHVPKSIVWHNNAGSSGSGSELHDYYLTRNRMLFGMKYAPLKVKIHLIRESLKFLLSGRKWQRIGIYDFIFWKFGRGSYLK